MPRAASVPAVPIAVTLVPILVTCYLFLMQVIARQTLAEFWRRHPPAERPIRAWFAVVSRAHWRSPAEVKRQFGSTVDSVGDNRLIFDLGGNKYRAVVHVSYAFGRVLIKFIGTHAQYDRIDPERVGWRK